MNVKSINMSKNSFKGLLIISGPNKDKELILNTDNISTISKHSYIGKTEDAALGVGLKTGSVIAMNNNTNIHTFLPLETIIDAYKKAKVDNEYKLETKYDPVIEKGLLNL